MRAKLTEIGFSPREVSGNLVARRGAGEPLLLCCHLDTVEPTTDLNLGFEDGVFYSRGDSILGADDKAGLAALLAVLPEIPESAPVEVLLTVGEELGMEGAKQLKPGDLKARAGLVLDAGEPVGTVINRASGEMQIQIKMIGKTAHAAAAPQEGIDAIRMAARFITQLPPHMPDKETSLNIGIIRGGSTTNTICDLVELTGEIRSFSPRRRQDLAGELEALAQATTGDSGGTFQFHSQQSYDGYTIAPEDNLIGLLRKTANAAGFGAVISSRNAGSDANILNQLGVTTVNLGTGYTDGHSPRERVALAEMNKLARWLRTIIGEWSDART